MLHLNRNIYLNMLKIMKVLLCVLMQASTIALAFLRNSVLFLQHARTIIIVIDIVQDQSNHFFYNWFLFQNSIFSYSMLVANNTSILQKVKLIFLVENTNVPASYHTFIL